MSSMSKVASRISSPSPALAINVSTDFPFLHGARVYARELPFFSGVRQLTIAMPTTFSKALVFSPAVRMSSHVPANR